MLTALLLAAARADTIQLDTGAVLQGDLARYEFGGDCQVSVTEGEYTGVIVIVPCHRVQSFVRTAVRTPEPIGAPAAPEQLVTDELTEAPLVEAPLVDADAMSESPTELAPPDPDETPVIGPALVPMHRPAEAPAAAGAPTGEPNYTETHGAGEPTRTRSVHF